MKIETEMGGLGEERFGGRGRRVKKESENEGWGWRQEW